MRNEQFESLPFVAARRVKLRFCSVYGTLGPGQYFTARLIHGTEDTSVTYAMQVQMFVREK